MTDLSYGKMVENSKQGLAYASHKAGDGKATVLYFIAAY